MKLRTGPWKLSELEDISKNGFKVLSTFSCGGGSTMGYKLAGYEVIGCVEIDPEMLSIYKENHKPKYSYLMGVQDFKKIPNEELPKEFFELDILDGSPPCSSFSMAGSREKKWGKASHFREGQAVQNLDDLFFEFIDVAEKLKPKIIVAENVKGLIQGNAKGYVKQIFQGFKKIGYDCQLFLLNAATMGVPQARERVFFIANNLGRKIDLKFSEKFIATKVAVEGCGIGYSHKLRPAYERDFHKIAYGKSVASVNGVGFARKINPELPAPTQTADQPSLHWKEVRHINIFESQRIQTFPDDYKAPDKLIHYICGMSVPPFMMQRIAHQIKEQLLGSP